jgi:hypothetical protein
MRGTGVRLAPANRCRPDAKLSAQVVVGGGSQGAGCSIRCASLGAAVLLLGLLRVASVLSVRAKPGVGRGRAD